MYVRQRNGFNKLISTENKFAKIRMISYNT